MATEQELEIKVKLEGEAKDMFLEIKAATGLTNNTEVLRFIINNYYKLRHKEGA